MVPRKNEGSKALPVRIDESPSELRQCPQWVTWRLETRNGNATKVPYAKDGRRASSTDLATWTTFEGAIRSYRDNVYDGIGFVFTENDPYVGVDLDKCRDPDTGTIEPAAQAIIERLNSYTETSPSGTGVHIVARAKKPGERCRKAGMELYDRGRFFCVSGHHIVGTPTTIEDRHDVLAALYVETFGEDQNVEHVVPCAPTATIEDDDKLIERAVAAANGEKLRKLWAGSIDGYPSASEADLALCSLLAFWCGKDRERIDRLFRRSGLYDQKWERADYRERTINVALNGRTEFYGNSRSSGPADEIAKPGYLTEFWAAERLVERHGRDLRYSVTHGWLAWDGTRWRRDDIGEVERRAKETVRSIYALAANVEDKDRRTAMVEFGKSCERAARINAIITLARSEPGIPITADQLDADPWLLNVQNGTIDLQTGKLRPHSRDDRMTKIAPVVFDPVAECPLWLAFLDRIFAGEEMMIRFVRRALGHALTGVVREHVLHVLYGSGANGKTTLIEAIIGMLGNYAMTAAPGLLLARHSEQHPTERADLWGKRFVSSVETGEGRRFNEELVKQLTGNDTIKARFMRQDFFEFSPTHKLFLATNHKPEVRGTDRAMWRRIQLWPFLVTIPDAEQDRELPEKLKAESPGILRWCVGGCIAWQRKGLAAPDSVLAAPRAYREESDMIGQFIQECCAVGESKEVRGGVLYWAYTAWCGDDGHKPLSNPNFSKRLLERDGITRLQGGAYRVYHGLQLRLEMQQRYDRARDHGGD